VDQPRDAVDMTQPLKVYWAPGCSSCLRTKEFLTKKGVPFVSINAFADEEGFSELARFGIRRVPIVARGDHWADGQVLKDVARLAGVAFEETALLAPRELAHRGVVVLDAALRLLPNIEDGNLLETLPGRDRSYLALGSHVFRIIELFLEQMNSGRRVEFEDYLREDVPGVVSAATLQAYGGRVRQRFSAWAEGLGDIDFVRPANVYYGEPTLHEFFERSVWHAAQHTRQLEEVVRKLGVVDAEGLSDRDLAGLSVPDDIYDDRIRIR
jgi:hypothetical protein